MAINEELFTKSVCDQLDALLSSTDLSKVTSEGVGFDDLPVGYYLTEVENAVLTASKTTGAPMVTLRLKVVEDGVKVNDNDELETINSTKNRVIFKHYPFTDSDSLKRYVKDMLTFEGIDNEPLLPKEAWTSSATMKESIEVLDLAKPRVWISNTLAKKPNELGVYNTYINLLSWERAGKLGLRTE